MKKYCRKYLWFAAVTLMMFLIWTILVLTVDRAPAGLSGAVIGLSRVNSYIHSRTGVNMYLYRLTDWLSFIPAGTVVFFGMTGFIQLIKRKSIFRVDPDILALGVFYTAVLAVYVFFEIFVVNCRPVLIDGVLEASYPSSTTVLVLCVMITAAMQIKFRIKNANVRKTAIVLLMIFTFFMVAVRFISGVHWFSDIIGGILLSAGLIMLYKSACCFIYGRKK